MRRAGIGAVAIGLAAIGLATVLSGCVAGSGVDPDDAAGRAAGGSVVGATLGTGFGAVLAITPAVGAPIGAAAGAAIGVAVGIATAQPAVTYDPITPPDATVIPGFYDNWAPGSHSPPVGSSSPPPLPRSG